MANLQVNFTKTVGKIKPMHGVNHGPLTNNLRSDASDLFREAGIPITRLHDCEYPFGSGEYVDVPCIFKWFDADVNDPASYNFDLTDRYLLAIQDVGTEILYRLGVSIEHQTPKRYIYPPKDYLKWAQICEHIIRHYNEGWANGYHMGIRYWEIWTEPNHCILSDSLMWGSDAPEFAKFYTVAADYLKGCFPDLKIGGPAFSSPDSIFVEDFFTSLTKDGHHPAMDFFSWHGYVSDTKEAVRRARFAKDLLHRYGYDEAESIYDEWNFVKSWSDMNTTVKVVHDEKGAAFNAAMMIALQNEECDMMNYYAVYAKWLDIWNGLFRVDPNGNRRNGSGSALVKAKPFEAFLAFNQLYRLGAQAELTCDDERVYALAATDGAKDALMISSFAALEEELQEKEVRIALTGMEGKQISVYYTDATHSGQKLFSSIAGKELTLVLPPYSIVLVTTE